MIYTDNAATTQLSPTVAQTVAECMNKVYGNPSSLHSMGKEAAKVLFEARQTIARCINCQPREIYFTSGGSESDNQAIRSAAHAGKKNNKLHIISTAIEHHAVLHTLDRLKTEGFEIRLLDVDQRGWVSPRQIADAIRKDTCLVTVMYANNEIGTILPIKEIGEICRKKGVVFHTDAVQAVGHIPVDVQKDNIDLLSLSGHKFHGPKGVGVLFARKGTALENLIDGGAQERGKRAGTENVPALAGMAQALKEACDEMQQVSRQEILLRDRIVRGLSKIPHSCLNGDRENRLPGNISFCFEGIQGESLLLKLDEKGICASSGSACTSGALDPSHVLLAIGRSREIAHGSLRLSLSRYNTMEEAKYIIKTVSQAVDYLRSFSPLWKDKLSGKKPFVL
ncbi:MAG: cysteine desulfurase [Ruminococcus sp.]|nr:cysteine desulfurase [Ruminococcus sp.]MBQ4247594.1 cysteine desulfurase [Ruminococcus sp.]